MELRVEDRSGLRISAVGRTGCGLPQRRTSHRRRLIGQEARMDLLEFAREEPLRRESVAERLRALADELARHNEVEFTRDGRRYTVRVPDEVEYSFEIEIGDDGAEIEVELKW
jgi:amphi-Trp domain-containing protein